MIQEEITIQTRNIEVYNGICHIWFSFHNVNTDDDNFYLGYNQKVVDYMSDNECYNETDKSFNKMQEQLG